MSLRPPGILSSRLTAVDSLCWRCTRGHGSLPLTTAARPFILHPPPTTRRTFAQSRAHRSDALAAGRPSRLKASYFLSNGALPGLGETNQSQRNAASTTNTAAVSDNGNNGSSPSAATPSAQLPHRRRQAAKRNAAAAAAAGDTSDSSSPSDVPMPPDASSQLTTAAAAQSTNSMRQQFSLFLSLSKPRLTMLVVLSAMASYAVYPVPAFLSPSIGLDTPSLSPLTLTFLTTGTTLCSASANALNMLYETDTDAKMSRTRNRPLVRGLLTRRKGIAFAVGAALLGVGSLWFGVNPTVAFLGAANIAIYAGMYTPMKRMHWFNTWVGAIVGGIPPLMGWAAAAGESATGDGGFRELLFTSDAVGGWLMGSLLFAWQFPHFMALSWIIREDYKAAGHQMLSWINPARNARVALRYSIIFFPICIGLCAVGVTEWAFAVASMPVNVWLTREAIRFWQHEGHKGSARGLFWASVWHLPVVFVLALATKKGMWTRVWRSVMGEPRGDEDDEDGEWEYFDDDEDAKSGGVTAAVIEARVRDAAREAVPVVPPPKSK